MRGGSSGPSGRRKAAGGGEAGVGVAAGLPPQAMQSSSVRYRSSSSNAWAAAPGAAAAGVRAPAAALPRTLTILDPQGRFTPEALQLAASLSIQQLQQIVYEVQALAAQMPVTTRQALLQHPLLCEALLHAQLLTHFPLQPDLQALTPAEQEKAREKYLERLQLEVRLCGNAAGMRATQDAADLVPFLQQPRGAPAAPAPPAAAAAGLPFVAASAAVPPPPPPPALSVHGRPAGGAGVAPSGAAPATAPTQTAGGAGRAYGIQEAQRPVSREKSLPRTTAVSSHAVPRPPHQTTATAAPTPVATAAASAAAATPDAKGEAGKKKAGVASTAAAAGSPVTPGYVSGHAHFSPITPESEQAPGQLQKQQQQPQYPTPFRRGATPVPPTRRAAAPTGRTGGPAAAAVGGTSTATTAAGPSYGTARKASSTAASAEQQASLWYQEQAPRLQQLVEQQQQQPTQQRQHLRSPTRERQVSQEGQQRQAARQQAGTRLGSQQQPLPLQSPSVQQQQLVGANLQGPTTQLPQQQVRQSQLLLQQPGSQHQEQQPPHWSQASEQPQLVDQPLLLQQQPVHPQATLQHQQQHFQQLLQQQQLQQQQLPPQQPAAQRQPLQPQQAPVQRALQQQQMRVRPLADEGYAQQVASPAPHQQQQPQQQERPQAVAPQQERETLQRHQRGTLQRTAPKVKQGASAMDIIIAEEAEVEEAAPELVTEVLKTSSVLHNILESTAEQMMKWGPDQRRQVLSVRKALRRQGYLPVEEQQH